MSQTLKGGFASFSAFNPTQQQQQQQQPTTTPNTGLFSSGINTTAGTTGTTSAPATSTFGGFSGFGTTSTTPSTGIFGTTTPASTGPFGAAANTTASTTAPSTQPATTSTLFSGFGAPTNTNAANPTQTSTTTPSLFGAPSGGLFGAKPAGQNTTGTTAPTSTAIPTLGSAFGPNLPKPAGAFFGGATAGSTSTPAAGSTSTTTAPSFFSGLPKPTDSGASATAATTTLAAPAFSLAGGLFSKPDTPTNPTTAPATGATGSTSLFSGFGKKPEETGPPAGSTPAPTTTTTGTGLFGATPGATSSSSITAPAPAATSTPFGLGIFGAKKPDTPAESKEAAADAQKKDATPPATSVFSLGSVAPKKDETGATTITSTTGAPASAATPSIAVPPPSMLRGKTIEEIVNKWSSDLEAHVKEFNRLAGEINVWDRALIDNGNTIAALYQHVVMAEREQSDIEQSLKHVEEQQKELSATLEVYEKSLGELLDSQSGHRGVDVGPADAERDKHYTLASELHSNLDDLSRNLTQMIDSVNTLTDSNDAAKQLSKGDAPLEQIAQILSSHLESLQWIDGAVREVDTKVTDVEKRLKEASIGNSGVGANGSSTTGYGSSTRSRGYGFMSR